MTKDQLTEKFIDLNEQTIEYMGKITAVLDKLNDSNRLHKDAVAENTNATREMTKSFNRIWYILLIVILALVVLSGAEKVLKFL